MRDAMAKAMGIRFRKSLKLGTGVRLNVGKRSASVRVGGKGFGITSGTAGSRATAGIPGSGISYTTKLGGAGAGNRRQPDGATKIEEIVYGIVALFFVLGVIIVLLVGLAMWLF
jgi:hypothetical protein